ncbi:MAG: acyl carrier protein [Gemmatimonadaceae bacterium]|nr:acyl carrier protein [Gemmatimonadaceae bacterium]MDQ3242299.1 acyl carrier protein [Gemmatimonadota bacterium]
MSVSYDEAEQFLREEIASMMAIDPATIDADTVLIGANRVLDSADLVMLLLAVEDFARDRLGVAFDWTSDSAMSEARSVLRSVGSLARHLTDLQSA